MLRLWPKLSEAKARPAFRVLAGLLGGFQLLLGIWLGVGYLFFNLRAKVDWLSQILLGTAMLWSAYTGYWPGNRPKR